MQTQNYFSGPVYGYHPAYRKALHQYRTSYVLPAQLDPAKSESSARSEIFAPLVGKMISYVDFSQSHVSRDKDPIIGMFSEKVHFNKAVIEDLVTDIAVRYDMMNKAIETLDHQICAVDSQLFQLPYFQIGVNKDLDKLKTALEAKVMDMEQQKNEERVAGWKDITRIKTDLVTVLKEYSVTNASSAFLTPTPGGESHH